MSIQEKCIEKGWTLTLAESCTGGGVSARLVQQSGASKYFLGSLVVYSNELKTALLQVPESLLATKGAVSAECAALMCQKLHRLTQSTWTGSITGIAGPTGGSKEKPVGTVYMAVAFQEEEPKVKNFLFKGDRKEIIRQSEEAFLSFLEECILFAYER